MKPLRNKVTLVILFCCIEILGFPQSKSTIQTDSASIIQLERRKIELEIGKLNSKQL